MAATSVAGEQLQVRSVPYNYRGTAFRSTLEATWARTFDRWGLKWTYEPERFETAAGSYLPDFYFPDLGQYAEAKGYANQDMDKVEAFCQLRGLGEFLVLRPASSHHPDVAHWEGFFGERWYWAEPQSAFGVARSGRDIVHARQSHMAAWSPIDFPDLSFRYRVKGDRPLRHARGMWPMRFANFAWQQRGLRPLPTHRLVDDSSSGAFGYERGPKVPWSPFVGELAETFGELYRPRATNS
jgi:hypothetical protein